MTKKAGSLWDAMPAALNQNFLTRDGAQFLVNKIRAYWLARGQTCDVWTVQQELPRGTMPIYNVRSRMLGGWP